MGFGYISSRITWKRKHILISDTGHCYIILWIHDLTGCFSWWCSVFDPCECLWFGTNCWWAHPSDGFGLKMVFEQSLLKVLNTSCFCLIILMRLRPLSSLLEKGNHGSSYGRQQASLWGSYQVQIGDELLSLFAESTGLIHLTKT